MRLRRRGVSWRPLVVAAAVFLVGCQSEPDNTLEVVDVSTTTSIAVVTSPVPTSVVDSVVTTTSVVETSVVSEATVVTETSVVDEEALKAQVAADFLAAIEARGLCGVTPESCDFVVFALPGSVYDEFTRSVMAERIALGLRAKPGVGEQRVEVESVELSADAAHVVSCAFDDVVLFQIHDPANPEDDTIYDDSSVSARLRWNLVLSDGRWRISNAESLERAEGRDLCLDE